jgi:hypothetical protein
MSRYLCTQMYSVLNICLMLSICNTAVFKLIPLCTHVYSYMFSTVHPLRVNSMTNKWLSFSFELKSSIRISMAQHDELINVEVRNVSSKPRPTLIIIIIIIIIIYKMHCSTRLSGNCCIQVSLSSIQHKKKPWFLVGLWKICFKCLWLN